MFDDKTIERNQSRMESARMGFDSLRREIAALILPNASQYDSRYMTQGMSNAAVQYDEYAALACDDGVSAFEGFTMPRGQKWQRIKVSDERLMANVRNQQWFESKATLVFSMRNDPKSGFTNATHTSGTSLFAYGEQSTWVDKRFDPMGRFIGLSYQSEDVGSIWVELDAEGNAMRIHRLFTLSAEQAKAKWQDASPPKVLDAMSPSNNQPRVDEPFEFIHVIERNDRMMAGRIGAEGMPWRACYYSRKDKAVFKVGGYRTLRRIVSRFERAHHEDYGRGPAMRVLPAIRASQIMMQDRVLAVELGLKRPMLAPSDDLDQAVINLGPWGITYGGLDEMGRETLKPLYDAPDLAGAQALHEEVHGVIDRAFYRDLMQINREMKTHITAARTLEEIGEKGILLAPLARQEQEWFAPMLDVELDLLHEEGFLDDMPPDIAEYFGAGGGVTVVYDNNLSRMQQAGEAAGYLRTAEQVGSIAQFDPSAVQAFVREYPLAKVIPGLGDVNGVPSRWRATDDEKAAVDDEKQREAMLQQVLAAAPVLANSAKSVAEAGAIGGA